MALPTLTVEGFKTFQHPTSFQLRPLTLLYGHNQAGKSTLLRLLPLLADSLQEGNTGLDMRSPALLGSTFKELGWLGPDPAKPHIAVEADHCTYRIELDSDNNPAPFVNRLVVAHDKPRRRFEVTLAAPVQRRSGSTTSTYRAPSTMDWPDWSGELTFRSFFPTGDLPDEVNAWLQPIRDALNPFHRLQWLYANRTLDLGQPPAAQRATRCCDPTGGDLADLLKPHEDTVVEAASAWLSDVLSETLSVQSGSRGELFFQLRRHSHEARPIHLAGEGVRSMLPILLCACWAEARDLGDGPTMLAIEEPESHLHPTLQVKLADRLVETVNAGIPIVLETHSVYILRAVQRAVLKGTIQPDDIALYWFAQDNGARLDPITVEPDATLTNWLPRTFEEEQELAQDIMQLRWERMKGERDP